jgi:hypothetical protein
MERERRILVKVDVLKVYRALRAWWRRRRTWSEMPHSEANPKAQLDTDRWQRVRRPLP